MFAVRRLILLSFLLSLVLSLAACQGDSTPAPNSRSRSIAKDFQWLPLFGDGANDGSGVIARVGEVEITNRDLELYRDELPVNQQSKYTGPDGERLLLQRMVEYTLMVQGAVKKELYNDQDVARTLIANRRNALRSAMLNYGLLRDRKPSEDEVRAYFMDYRDKYRQLGVVHARHIETLTKEAADAAFERLTAGGKGNDWMSVLVDATVNEETKELEGDVGWFNQGGVIPFIRESQKFTTQVYGMEIGLAPPVRIGGRWHVVEVLKRENSRPMTFAEARDQVEIDMMPAWQDALVKDWLAGARTDYPVEMMGRFTPGQGLTADELFTRAGAVADGEHKIELLNLIHSDYPQSERADDALFMAAITALETWTDVKVAERYLRLLLEEYPDSELAEDAQFLKDNLHNPAALNPQSIEDLRK